MPRSSLLLTSSIPLKTSQMKIFGLGVSAQCSWPNFPPFAKEVETEVSIRWFFFKLKPWCGHSMFKCYYNKWRMKNAWPATELIHVNTLNALSCGEWAGLSWSSLVVKCVRYLALSLQWVQFLAWEAPCVAGVAKKKSGALIPPPGPAVFWSGDLGQTPCISRESKNNNSNDNNNNNVWWWFWYLHLNLNPATYG